MERNLFVLRIWAQRGLEGDEVVEGRCSEYPNV
jgi:hypothetical protein